MGERNRMEEGGGVIYIFRGGWPDLGRHGIVFFFGLGDLLKNPIVLIPS